MSLCHYQRPFLIIAYDRKTESLFWNFRCVHLSLFSRVLRNSCLNSCLSKIYGWWESFSLSYMFQISNFAIKMDSSTNGYEKFAKLCRTTTFLDGNNYCRIKRKTSRNSSRLFRFVTEIFVSKGKHTNKQVAKKKS